MNIFFLDRDINKCAQYHCDKHVVKMILETAQLLCSAHWVGGQEAPYRKTHVNHPCSIWVRESLQNYLWLVKLGFTLCEEYTKRYGKIHKSQEVMNWCSKHLPNLPNNGFTEPPQCMPLQYKNEDPVQAYRNYYIGDKKSFAKWKNSEVPEWFLSTS